MTLRDIIKKAEEESGKKINIRTVVIGTTLYICDDETIPRIAKKANAAVERGLAVTWEDGSKEWVTYDPIWNKDKEGSAQFNWDKTGNKIEVVRKRHVAKAGTITVTVTGTKFIDYKRAFGD